MSNLNSPEQQQPSSQLESTRNTADKMKNWVDPQKFGKNLEQTWVGRKASENTPIDIQNRLNDPAFRWALQSALTQNGMTYQELQSAWPDIQKNFIDTANAYVKQSPDLFAKQDPWAKSFNMDSAIDNKQSSRTSSQIQEEYEQWLRMNAPQQINRNPQQQVQQKPNINSNNVGKDGTRLSWQQLYDTAGNSIGPNWQNGYDFRKNYSQSGANTLRDSGGNVQAQGANIDIGNGYKINVIDVQKWSYRFEWQTVKDSRWNTLPINKDDFQKLTKNIRRI
jgi:hypothetical protein